MNNKQKFKRGAFCKAMFLCGWLGLTACDDEGNTRPEGRPNTVAVVAHEVVYQPEILRVEAVGTSRARAAAVMYPETGGEVVEVLFGTGDFVEAGVALLRLESREEELAVRLAAVEIKDAEQILARHRRIEDTGAVSDSQVEVAQTAVDAARVALDQARNALAERTVRAPFSGFVGLSDVDAGARVTPTTEITRLDDRRVLYVDFTAPEQVFGRIAVGDKVSVTPFADNSAATQAEVVGLDSRVDATSRTLTVRTAIDNGADTLRPGMSFRVTFTLEGAGYPAIPEAATLWGSDGAYVWGVEEQVVRRKPVTIVAREKGYVLVRGDITEGSHVVLEGIQKVRDGTVVTVMNAEDLRGAQQLTATATSAGEEP